jgi:hypothetical protein
MDTYRLLRKSVHYLLLVFTLIFIITGFGITEYRIIESITYSVLTKPVSHLIHSNLIIPFVILLILHILLSIKPKFFKKPPADPQ